MLAPRAHGKTETSVSFITQEIAENRDIRVLLIGKTADGAKKRLRRIKSNLESNERLIHDYGRFKPEKIPAHLIGVYEQQGTVKRQINYWTERYIYVDRFTSKTDPTLEAIGWRGSILGGRFDLIVMDDPIDDILAASLSERRKAREWFYGTIVELLEPTGRMVVIGTRKHHDDLYGTLIQDTTFELVHDKAVSKWPKSYRGVYDKDEYGRQVLRHVEVEGESEVLWPERWGIGSLLRKLLAVKATIGSRVWLRENQNEVTDDEASEFPMVFFEGGEYRASPEMPAVHLPGAYDLNRSWLHTVYGTNGTNGTNGDDRQRPGMYRNLPHPRDSGILPAHLGLETADLMVVQGWDLSLVVDKARAEQRDTDWTVGITVALDLLTWRRYYCAMWRRRGIHPKALLKAIEQEFWRWGGPGKVQRVVIESVLFQQVYQLILQDETDLPIIGHSTGREKADPYRGIPHVSGLTESGKMRFPYATPRDKEETSTIVGEWHEWPESSHDDTLLATHVLEQRLGIMRRKTRRTGPVRPAPKRPSVGG